MDDVRDHSRADPLSGVNAFFKNFHQYFIVSSSIK